jgi:hypothetical protein
MRAGTHLCQLSLAGTVQGSRSSLPLYLCRLRNAELAEMPSRVFQRGLWRGHHRAHLP